MPTVRDEGFEHPALDHALHGAHRQAQHFGGLAGAHIGLVVLRCFHGAGALEVISIGWGGCAISMLGGQGEIGALGEPVKGLP